jgi:hypothetical protein
MSGQRPFGDDRLCTTGIYSKETCKTYDLRALLEECECQSVCNDAAAYIITAVLAPLQGAHDSSQAHHSQSRLACALRAGSACAACAAPARAAPRAALSAALAPLQALCVAQTAQHCPCAQHPTDLQHVHASETTLVCSCTTCKRDFWDRLPVQPRHSSQ